MNKPALLSIIAIPLICLALWGGSVLMPARAGAPASSPSPDPFGVYFYPGTSLVGGEHMAQAGAQWARLQIWWRDVEGSPWSYDWGNYDTLLAEAASRGFRIVLQMTVNPNWASDTVCGPVYPQHLPNLAEFLKAAVARYSVAPYNVEYWIIYNEPDNADAINSAWLGGCWGAGHPNQAGGAGGAAYAHMLSHVYPAMKAANPEVKVVLGSLAYDYFHSDSSGPFDPTFLDEVLEAGGGDFFDVLAFNYSTFFWRRWYTGDRYTSGIIGKANWLRNEVVRVTGASKPILVSELGRATAPAPGETNRPYSDELTAQYVLQANARAMAAGISPIIWFQAVDEPWLLRPYGLLQQDLTPKPAYDAYGVLTREMAGARFLAPRYDLPEVVEGYDFLVKGRLRTVLWLVTEDSQVRSPAPERQLGLAVSKPGAALHIVDKFGLETAVVDGSPQDLDGQQDGVVTILLDSSPRIVQDVSRSAYHSYFSLTLRR
jgi:hypothetical protein